MKVVVGLGNPGQQYDRTRHNVGFDVMNELARRCGESFQSSKFDAVSADVRLGDERVQLLMPLTYMNRSGRSVRRAVDFFRLDIDDLLVICDDMNLERGRLRLRGSGSAGGQKGIADIISALGSNEFARLRIGIDRPPGTMDPAKYVLGRFNQTEWEIIEPAVTLAADAVETWVRDGLSAAMNRFNAAGPQ